MVPLYLDCGCAILTDGSRAPGCPTCSASTSGILALTPEQDGPRCRQCGCVDEDCSSCIERTGEPCFWFEPDLCSGCAFEHLSQELPAPPCSLCGQDDKMKQLPYTVTDFGGVWSWSGYAGGAASWECSAWASGVAANDAGIRAAAQTFGPGGG